MKPQDEHDEKATQKKPYSPPKVTESHTFETLAMTCTKQGTRMETCMGGPAAAS